MAVTRAQLVRDLRELITALDRRVPRVERAGEAGIAREAAKLKGEALRRIAELEADSLVRSAAPAAVASNGQRKKRELTTDPIR